MLRLFVRDVSSAAKVRIKFLNSGIKELKKCNCDSATNNKIW